MDDSRELGPALQRADRQTGGGADLQRRPAQAGCCAGAAGAGTSQTTESQYSWNFEPALAQAGIPRCAVSPPAYSMGDIQVAAEYDTYAIRTMSKAAGRKITVIGHSQGGMQPGGR